jgi:hypothetical protein
MATISSPSYKCRVELQLLKLKGCADLARINLVALFTILFVAVFVRVYGAVPGIVVTPELLDLGTVSQTDPAFGEFTITNNGDADLVINDVRTTCSCTVSDPDRKIIPPGESTKMKVKLTTSNKIGRQRHSVYIETNVPNQKLVQLRVSATVKPIGISICPSNLVFDNLRSTKSKTIHVEISAEEPDGIKLLDVTSQPDWIIVDSSSTGEVNQRRILLDVTLDPKKLNKSTSDSVRLLTNHPKQPIMEIPVTFSIVTPTIARTSTTSKRVGQPILNVLMPTTKKGNVSVQSVAVKGQSNDDFNITKADSPLNYVNVSIEKKKEHSMNRVWVRITSNAPVGKISTVIALKTSNLKQPIIRLRVSGLVTK